MILKSEPIFGIQKCISLPVYDIITFNIPTPTLYNEEKFIDDNTIFQ